MKEMWDFTKVLVGKAHTRRIVAPVRNKGGSLALEANAHIARVWEEHYTELARDETGNGRNAEMWDNLFGDKE